MENTIYLVTGAAGFLGSTICRQLAAQQKNIRAFVLPNDKAAKFLPKEVEIIEGDLCDPKSLEKFFDVPKAMKKIVLHIASIVTVNPLFNQKVMDVNVNGTQNVIDFCLKDKANIRLVYCSSTGAIPELKKGQPIREISHFDAAVLQDCYSQSKALATQAVLDAVRTADLDACVVHPSGILGPEDFSISETTKTVIEIIQGKMPAGIDGTFNLCDVRDLAQGIISAAHKGKAGNCYILGNDEISFKKFADVLAKESGCKPIKVFLPIKIAYIMAGMMEKSAKRKGQTPMMTKFSVYNLARNNVFDSSKAKRELDYTTRSYEETIRDEVKWLKKEGIIS